MQSCYSHMNENIDKSVLRYASGGELHRDFPLVDRTCKTRMPRGMFSSVEIALS